MSARSNDSWERPRSNFGDIQVGSDVKIRATFKDNLLDAIGIPFDNAGDLRIERRSLRLRAKAITNLFLNLEDVFLGVITVLETVDLLNVPERRRPNLCNVPIVQHPWIAIEWSEALLRPGRRCPWTTQC